MQPENRRGSGETPALRGKEKCAQAPVRNTNPVGAHLHSNAQAVRLVFQSGERKKMTKTAASFRFEKLPRFVSN